MPATRYPFAPKSTAYLAPGQFWPIPLSNGMFACGRVLQLDKSRRSRREFIAGLLDWCSESPPNQDSIAGASVLAHGMVHVKSIAENDGQILGHRSLELDDIRIPLSLDESPGTTCRLRQGFDVLGFASPSQQQQLSVFQTWGYRVIKVRAEKHFGSGPS